MQEPKPFLSRWSARKLEASKEASQLATQEQLYAQDQTVQEADKLDVAELIKTLPSLESITAGSDVSMFLQSWVPQDLQNSALRKLWVSDPMISEYVGEALDYAYDYNNPLEGSGFGALPATYDAMKYVNELFEKVTETAKIEAPAQSKQEDLEVAELEVQERLEVQEQRETIDAPAQK